jgi:deoxyhypusine monooxygenase
MSEIDKSPTRVAALKVTLLDAEAAIGKRMRSVFLLKQVGTHAAIDALSSVLDSPSILLAHESAYAIGQLGNNYALPLLIAAVEDVKLDVIVRHEAAEALGAIMDEKALEVLNKYKNDASEELAQTCQIAITKITQEHGLEANGDGEQQVFNSIDPTTAHESKDVSFLSALLIDTSAALYDRYKAMFALRNLRTEESVQGLVAGLTDDSALFKHEICYVLGQMAHPSSLKALESVVKDETQHEMVRHEAAEALGEIDHPDVQPILEAAQHDANQIVAESCKVGLDIADFFYGEQETATTATTEQQ